MDMSKKDEMLKKHGVFDKTEFTDEGAVIHLASLYNDDTYRSNPGESLEDFLTRLGWSEITA